MSKRQLNSRIKDLFAELSDEPLVSQGQDTARLAGWTWEADGHGIYTAISPEIKSFLGYSGESLVGQPVTEGLEAGSDLNLQRALESSQFPAELQLNYLTNSGNFLATNIELFPIPWQPDEPFQREKNLGWRAIVHPAAPELPQHHRVEGQIEALNQAKAEKPEPRIRKKTPGISLPAAPGFPADWLNQPAAAPRGYLAEDQHVQHSQEILTDLGWQSLADNQPARRPAESGEQAILAFSTQLPDGNTSLLLELLDEDAGRDWNASERMLVEQVASQLTLALENAQLFQQTQNALAATSALYAASAAFSAAHSHAEILKALQQFSQLGQADKLLAIHYFDHPWSETQPALRSELLSGWAPSRSEIKQLTLRLDDPQSTQFLFADRITILNNLSPFNSKSDAITLLRDRFQLDTLVCIPLVTGGEWLGFVSAGYSAAVHFSAEDELRLMALSSQAAIAINNLQLLAETRQRNQELAAINRIVTAVAGSKDLQSSLGIIAAEMGISLKVQTGIALLNEERQVMTIVASYSPIPNAPEVIGIDLPIQGNPSTQQVLATRKTLVVEDAQHNPLTSAIHNELHLRSIESLMIIPLIVDERVIGTVGLDILEPSRHYTPDEIRLAETIVLQASTAIQSTRLFEQTELALAETETLYKASAEFNHAESYAQVLEILRRFTMVGHAATTSLLALFEEPQLIGYGPLVIPDWYLPIATWSASSAEVFTARRLPIQDFPAANELLKPDAPSILFDVENDLHLEYPARQIYSQRYQAKSVLFAPLVTGGHWIGFLGTFFNHPKALSNPDIRRLMVLTGQASVAIQNIRLLEESRRRADQLQTAAEVARDTSSTLALDALLLRVVNLLCDRFGYNHASVFLLDEDGIYAVVREATGEAGAEMKHRPHKLGVGSQSVIGTVTRNGLPLVINDVSHSSVHRPNPLLPDTRAELGIPLKIGQRVIGALDVQSNEINAFTPDDVAVLQVLADQIAVAVDNARAYMISQQAVEEMREVDRLKSQFLANMSHELRTPLNSIIGFSRVILKGIDGPLTDLQEQDLSAIYNSGQHLLNLINDVLDLSKIEAGKLELAFDDKVNLPDLINSVMSTVVGLVKDKPIQLTRNISANLPSVRADPTKIRQVLINLFSNAAKFSGQGSIAIKAFKQTGPDGKPEIMLQITDTGPGIALEHQAKLFQPFSQVDASLTRKTGGTGLGLSICRHLVELHGGRIGLESEVGIGSTFFFTIPVQLPATGSLTAPDARLVLVIDDERPIVQLYERYLNRHGYRVIGLSEPQDALRRAREVMPYAILLDVMMPGRDGWHVLEDLKSDPDTCSIPVIMCTILESQAKGQSLGADGYLTKPILEEELVHTLSNLEVKAYKYNILGITDNDREFERFQAVFKDEPDYQLGLAFGGHQAISSMQFRRPDAILLAIEPLKTKSTHPLSGLSVISLLETIRNDPLLQDIPVILFAELPLDARHGARIQELATAVIPKNDWAKETVMEKIQQLLNQKNPAS